MCYLLIYLLFCSVICAMISLRFTSKHTCINFLTTNFGISYMKFTVYYEEGFLKSVSLLKINRNSTLDLHYSLLDCYINVMINNTNRFNQNCLPLF